MGKKRRENAKGKGENGTGRRSLYSSEPGRKERGGGKKGRQRKKGKEEGGANKKNSFPTFSVVLVVSNRENAEREKGRGEWFEKGKEGKGENPLLEREKKKEGIQKGGEKRGTARFPTSVRRLSRERREGGGGIREMGVCKKGKREGGKEELSFYSNYTYFSYLLHLWIFRGKGEENREKREKKRRKHT